MTGLPHSLYRAAQVRELDRRAIEEHGIPGYTLMTRAGAAAYACVRRRWPEARRIVVLCGAGNNGGDGYVLARLARQDGLAVSVAQLGETDRLGPDARRAREAWLDAGGTAQPYGAGVTERGDVLVDAVFGTGLQRDVQGTWAEAIEAINRSARPVLALDVPSGLDADRGSVLGTAVRAAATVTFIGLKQGLFTAQGPDACGDILFDDLQVPNDIYLGMAPSASRISHDILPSLLPERAPSSHKGRNGHVLVIGGDHGMMGAALMAGEAAARVGAGLVSVATHPQHAPLLATVRPELMGHGVSGPTDLEPLLRRASVIALGPGLGQSRWAQLLLARALDSRLPLVVDADALNLLAHEPVARGNWILTPHPGEAGRLLGCSAAEIQCDRFAALDALVDAFQGVCVLKGAGSLVHAPGAGVHLCDAGNPGMASGGMGDVLTGVIAGLLAQGLDLEDAARAGVYVHAAAGDAAARRGGMRGLLATDLLAELRRLVNPLVKEAGS
ncbi:MAG: NAD(P)H-hydrate dehydratase [Gammaproteobacteria bacterium]